MEEEGCGDNVCGGHSATLGQHFLAAGAEGNREVSKNNYREDREEEEDAAPAEEVIGGDRDVTSDFVGPDNNNRRQEYENSRFAFPRLGYEPDRRVATVGGVGEGGWRDGRLTALRLARARLRREQQATFDGRCGGGGGIGGTGGGGKKGQQMGGLGGNGEDEEDDYTRARDDDDEEIEANDTVTCDSNQQVRS